ncbi:hypothetical protein [Pseudomaricurvus sp.]|uniref:hypothetical protein n=1 Tax=Pseudomaricurvus sp. TaxID=2004510 RepID=UPI003F6CA58F
MSLIWLAFLSLITVQGYAAEQPANSPLVHETEAGFEAELNSEAPEELMPQTPETDNAVVPVTSPESETPAETVPTPTEPDPSTETATDPSLLENSPKLLYSEDQETSYLDAIAEIENTYGPYDRNLSQHLMGLGVNYQNRGRHVEAVDIFRRAMHVSRISDGLYSLSQIPMLEHLIESGVASGDWESANESHQYLYWLYKRNFGENDPRMLPAITKLSNWHLNAYALDGGSGLFEHLINAHNLYNMAISIISRAYGEYDLRLVGALKGLTVSNYYLATYQTSAAQRDAFQTGFSTSRSQIDEKARLDQYILNSYSSGKAAISRIRDVYASNPQIPEDAEVVAQIQLADWNLLFNRWHTAMDLYQSAYDALVASPDGKALADEYFSRPVALPDMPLLKSNLDTTEETGNEYVLVSFDVTRNGHARNVEILESYPEDNTRNRSQVRKALKQTKFRPRFADGTPTDTQHLTHRYVFSN